jgi:hypothetical protein
VERKSFVFGRTKVTVLMSVDYQEGNRRHHEVTIETTNPLVKEYLKYEVLDLVAYALGMNPVENKPSKRSLTVIKENHGTCKYELRWTSRIQ